MVVGIFGGAFAGIGIWGLDRIREAWLFKRDENRILKLLKSGDIAFDWSTSHRISADVNLKEERANYVCSNSKRII